jgi:hypothetical protein
MKAYLQTLVQISKSAQYLVFLPVAYVPAGRKATGKRMRFTRQYSALSRFMQLCENGARCSFISKRGFLL